MNELALLGAFIEHNHTDRIAALALADVLYEHHGFTRVGALRVAARHRKAGRDRFELAEAARLMGRENCMAVPLANHIRNKFAEPAMLHVAIYLVPGSRPPRLHLAKTPSAFFRRHCSTITVGARWVIRANSEILESWGAALDAEAGRGLPVTGW